MTAQLMTGSCILSAFITDPVKHRPDRIQQELMPIEKVMPDLDQIITVQMDQLAAFCALHQIQTGILTVPASAAVMSSRRASTWSKRSCSSDGASRHF